MASIILLQVRKSFGEVCVLEGVDLHIRDEEIRCACRAFRVWQVNPVEDDRRTGIGLGR